ncbi:methylated-DNA--[protein]-cysteine S-methyltransferase [Oryzihumus leptocrescens]|uniref:Methylated-DNA--protein-cysteine methyltransferase n=1 Tax=Oryzihumus leptocrescens TaxID=297536 RepID=A0A542ZFZ7_9MICO|nr:methylated-DNA--[protein]-cysteine S-methyltransferase [Oryzihumus leptocrescens]TQL59219.1 methylated-DNA-[protein]-cysteine S-methyltransferase [Oryzihumus leptocrescens]
MRSEPVKFTVQTPLPCGPVDVTVTDVGVARLSFFGDRERAVTGPAAGDDPRVARVRAALADYFAGRTRGLDLPVDWRHTSGPQREVLRTLHAQVGFGETVTYGDLARRSGAFEDDPEPAMVPRTVGTIMGSNPVPLVVPCHRVVASNGLGGFTGGLAIKQWLLTLEGVLAPTLDWSPAD